MRRALAGLAAALVLLAMSVARAADVTVFAAASLTDALNEIGTAYQKRTGQTAAMAFAASSVLARQIANAQGADVFISADTEWMDYLDKRSLLAPGTRKNLL